MRHLTLFPNCWKYLALVLLAASIMLAVANDHYHFEFAWLSVSMHTQAGIVSEIGQNLTDELWVTGIIGSLLMLCFCRERVEDEYVRDVRLHAWQWAIVTNYLLFLIAEWTIYGLFAFLGVIMYNVLTPLVLYLIIFYFRLHVLPGFKKSKASV